MKKLLSIQYSGAMFNLSMLLLRLGFGLLLIAKHGLPKLMDFAALQYKFYSFMGMGSRFTLVLAIFAELFCSMFIILGLFTRFAAIPVIITMCAAIFGAGAGQPLINSELAILYLTAFLVLFLLGPGRVSVDGMMKG